MDKLQQAIESFASDTGFDDADDMLEFLNMHGLKLVLKEAQQEPEPETEEDESLTEVELNVLLANGGGLSDKAVRVIGKRDAKIARLTEELALEKELVTLHARGASEAEREVRELTEKHAALVAQVAELTRERDEARAKLASAYQETHASCDYVRVETEAALEKSESEVARLTEALAAAEREKRAHEQRWLAAEHEGMAAEARVRELDYANEQRRLVIDALESKLIAANARIEDLEAMLQDDAQPEAPTDHDRAVKGGKDAG